MTTQTIKHDTDSPLDDRPDYLKGTPFMIAVDTETTGLDWSGDSYPFLATVSDYDRNYKYDLSDPEDTARLREAILAADGLIFHNASIDIHMLVSVGVVTMEEVFDRPVHDTLLLSQLVLGEGRYIGDHGGNFQLKSLACALIDPDADKYEQQLRERMKAMGLIQRVDQKDVGEGTYYQVWQAYPTIMEDYAQMDTRYTYDLYYLLMERASEKQLVVYELERKVLPVIINMEHTGLKLEGSKVEVLQEEYSLKHDDERRELEELMISHGIEDPNPNSNEQISELLLKSGVPLTKTTDSGALRVDRWALEPFVDEHPIAALVLSHRHNGKFLSTYIEPMLGRPSVHPSFFQIGARTSRTSCSRPNLQNIPVRGGAEMREMFVPREGYVFAVADYSSIELRILAYYMNSDELWNIINTGDAFEWLGEQIYGTRDQSQWPVSRSRLKNGFYAMTYGAGGPKLAATIGGGMTDQQGRELRRAMTDALGPKYKQLQDAIRKAVYQRGKVHTITGRALRIERGKEYIGLNSLIQGSAADIMKQGLIEADKELRPVGGRILLTVHDEILAEVEEAKAYDGLQRVIDGMKAASNLVPDGKLPLEVEGVICQNNYGEAK